MDKGSLKKNISSAYSALFRTKTLTAEEIKFSQLKRCLSVVDLSSLGRYFTLLYGTINYFCYFIKTMDIKFCNLRKSHLNHHS